MTRRPVVAALAVLSFLVGLPITADARREKRPPQERTVHVYGAQGGDIVTVGTLDGEK